MQNKLFGVVICTQFSIFQLGILWELACQDVGSFGARQARLGARVEKVK